MSVGRLFHTRGNILKTFTRSLRTSAYSALELGLTYVYALYKFTLTLTI